MTREQVIAGAAIVLGFVVAVALLWPSDEEIARVTALERNVDPTSYLELGVVLVVLAAISAASVAFRACGGAL